MRCLQVKFPYTKDLSPWGGWFHLYLPVLLCRLETFAMVCSSLSLVQILQHDASEQCVCCNTATALGQEEQMAGGLGTPGAVCSWCVSPSPSMTKWMHCPSKALDVTQDKGLGEAVDLQGFYRTSLCSKFFPCCTPGCFPQFCWSVLLEGKQEQGGPAEQQTWVDPALLRTGFAPWDVKHFPYRSQDISLMPQLPLVPASPFPSQTMAVFVIHSKLSAQPMFGEGAYIALAVNMDQLVIFPFVWAPVKLGIFSSFLLLRCGSVKDSRS